MFEFFSENCILGNFGIYGNFLGKQFKFVDILPKKRWGGVFAPEKARDDVIQRVCMWALALSHLMQLISAISNALGPRLNKLNELGEVIWLNDAFFASCARYGRHRGGKMG